METKVDFTLRRRVATAVVLASFVLCLGMLSSYFCFASWAILGVGFVLVEFAAWEFSVLSAEQQRPTVRSGILFLIVALPAFFTLWHLSGVAICEHSSQSSLGYHAVFEATFFPTLCAVLFMIVEGMGALEKAREVSGELFLALFLIGYCGSFLLLFVTLPSPFRALLWLLLVVCLNDTAAYFTGKKFGGPKVAPILSPGKTVSGSVGGLLGGIVTGMLFAPLLGIAGGVIGGFELGLLTTVAAQMGDLSKSYLKRLHNVKDSGTILPGHGGILDRIDGILMGAPLVYWWVQSSSF